MTTSNQKKTALYCRLSQDDNTENESNSIQNQKMILQRYAADHHFPNPCFYVDDGHTGTNFQRPGFQQMMADMEKTCHWTDSTIANMLENELYLGNTVNMRFSSKSYKDKRKVEHPREECLVFEGTHPALVTQEVWDIVQRVRQNRRRPTKMNKQNKYSGLVVCADCGSTMVLHLPLHPGVCAGRGDPGGS